MVHIHLLSANETLHLGLYAIDLMYTMVATMKVQCQENTMHFVHCLELVQSVLRFSREASTGWPRRKVIFHCNR